MIIDCHECNAKVDADAVAFVEQDMAFWRRRTFLLKCPSCKSPLVGECDDDPDPSDEEHQWTSLIRVYPKPGRTLYGVPKMVSDSLKEADKCLQIGANVAAAAMAGRALEAICRHYSTKDTYLGAGIKELRENGIIDSRLFRWSEELKHQRNLAAHATDATISAKDAADLVTFAYAIVDYVFLLTAKFEEFQKRKAKLKSD